VVLLVLGVQHRERRGGADQDREPEDHQRERLAGKALDFQADEADQNRRDRQGDSADVKEVFVAHAAVILTTDAA
jgi:hypothetical protein